MNLDIKITLHTATGTVEVEEEVYLWGDNMKAFINDERNMEVLQEKTQRVLSAVLKAGAE